MNLQRRACPSSISAPLIYPIPATSRSLQRVIGLLCPVCELSYSSASFFVRDNRDEDGVIRQSMPDDFVNKSMNRQVFSFHVVSPWSSKFIFIQHQRLDRNHWKSWIAMDYVSGISQILAIRWNDLIWHATKTRHSRQSGLQNLNHWIYADKPVA